MTIREYVVVIGKRQEAGVVSKSLKLSLYPRASVARHTAKLTPPATGDGPSWYVHVSAIATRLASGSEDEGFCLLTIYN